MLTNPRIGQCVRLHYAKKKRPMYPYHGAIGTVEIVSRGKPRNHGVRVGEVLVVVPCGNLVGIADRLLVFEDTRIELDDLSGELARQGRTGRKAQ